jgi:hypothetical protein
MSKTAAVVMNKNAAVVVSKIAAVVVNPTAAAVDLIKTADKGHGNNTYRA